MNKNTLNDDNGNMSDYDVQIESELYNHDYDEVYSQIEEEQKEETDILFQ